jgi:hypothetical protein
VKEEKNIYQAIVPQIQAGVAVMIFDNYRQKRDKEVHSILIKGKTYPEEIIIVNLYTLNVDTTNFTRLKVTTMKHCAKTMYGEGLILLL